MKTSTKTLTQAVNELNSMFDEAVAKAGTDAKVLEGLEIARQGFLTSVKQMYS